VEHLARNETEVGIKMLAEQGRITELANPRERVEAIARDYAAHPENTIIVSPDNRGPLQINDAVRAELLRTGALAEDGQTLSTLAHRSDMTGADRTWLRGTPSATYFNTPPAAGPKESSGTASLPSNRLMLKRTL